MTSDLVIIGAGLSGAGCAWALAQRGLRVTVLAGAEGASALPVGLAAAHITAQDLPASRLSRLGLACTLQQAHALLRQGVDWQPLQVVQRLLDTPAKNARLHQAAALLPQWFQAHTDHLLHLQAAWIKPQALVSAWLQHPKIAVQRGAAVAGLQQTAGHWQALDSQGQCLAQAPQLILAAATGAAELAASAGILLQLAQVEGQVALGPWPETSETSDAPLGAERAIAYNGNGHFIPAVPMNDGAIWLSGSTYERDESAPPQERQQQGLQANRARLVSLLPPALQTPIDAQFAAGQVQAWRGSRCTSPDRLPAVGQIAPGLHLCAAMGSRGLSFAALCAQVLAQTIAPIAPSAATPADSSALPDDLRHAIRAERLIIRA